MHNNIEQDDQLPELVDWYKIHSMISESDFDGLQLLVEEYNEPFVLKEIIKVLCEWIICLA